MGSCACTLQYRDRNREVTALSPNTEEVAGCGTPNFFPSSRSLAKKKKSNEKGLKDEISLPFLQDREK